MARTGTYFAYPERDEYDPDRTWASCFGLMLPHDDDAEVETITLDFEPHWSNYLTRQRWHASQEGPTAQPDGRARVTFRLHRTIDLIQWIRGLGDEVRVVTPVDLLLPTR